MGLLDTLGRFGHKINNGLDTAAYNALGGGLLGSALNPQQQPAPQQQQPPPQNSSGLLGVQGDGASDENPMQQQAPQQAPPRQMPPPPPQRWTPDAQQKHNLRGQFLTALSQGLLTGNYAGAQQNYQQNAVGQIQAGRQATLANQHQQAVAQFQQEIQAAGQNEQAVQQVLMKYSTILGPAETKAYADLHKSFAPQKGEFVPVGDLGYLNKATGQFQAIPHDKKASTPEQQAFDSLLQKHNGDATAAYQDLAGIKKPEKDPNFNPQRAFMVQAGGNPDDQSTWTPQVLAKFHQLTKPAPGSSITNNYGPAPDGAANPTIGAMARYEIPVPTPRSSSPAAMGEYTRLIAAIRKENPHYDATTYPAAQKTITDFTSGKAAGSINAINTAAGHLGVLAQAAKALDSGDITLMNRIANAYGLATGNDKLSVYKTIVHRLAPEITRSYVGAGGGEGDRVANESDFDPSLGTKRILANAGITANLYNSKINALGHQFEHGAPGRKFEGFITPEAQGVFDSLRAPQQQQQNPRAGYVAGHIYGGKTFLGGDPNNAASWR